MPRSGSIPHADTSDDVVTSDQSLVVTALTPVPLTLPPLAIHSGSYGRGCPVLLMLSCQP